MPTIEITIDEYVGREVKHERELKGYKQEELATAIGISTMGLSYLERGKRSWKPSTLEKVAKALGCKMTDFIPNH